MQPDVLTVNAVHVQRRAAHEVVHQRGRLSIVDEATPTQDDCRALEKTSCFHKHECTVAIVCGLQNDCNVRHLNNWRIQDSSEHSNGAHPGVNLCMC